MARNLFPFSSGKRSLIRVIRMQIPKAMQTTLVSRKTHLFRPSLTLFKTLGCVLAAWLLASDPGAARAATFGWSGSGTGPGSGGGNAWLTVGNWTNNAGTPTNGDIAFFGAGGSVSAIGFNLNTATVTTTNWGAIVLGAGSTIDRTIGNSATTATQSNIFLYGAGGGLMTNAVSGRTLTIAPFAQGGTTLPLALRIVNAGN